MIIVDLIKQTNIQQISTVFVDNTNFILDRNNVDIKMQEILKYYTDLYQATEGVVQDDKISNFYWR